ncbi:hypothetical protein K523DRAFT_418507 [Schizophyllum commune Tattone D]|nr:hypothetical protein K523DRAFT_418507 [Schizophyllum commune Tattone D]
MVVTLDSEPDALLQSGSTSSQWQGVVREPKPSPDRRQILAYISPRRWPLSSSVNASPTTTTKHSPSPLTSNNMYKFAVAIVAAFAVFFGQASAATLLADNPVDACNGSNHYGEGHDCAFKSADGTAEGVCHKDGSGVLTCVTN